jgi:hypothetical protein
MLGSGILDFAIGLVFTFLAVSLAAGAATEAFASFFKTRSSTLLQGVKDLLNDANFTGLALQLYQHGLISPRGNGSDVEPNKATDPAYIDSKQFATALVEIIKQLPSTPPPDGSPAPPPGADAAVPSPPAVALLHAKIANAPGDANGQLRKMLYGVVERAEGDEVRIRAELSTWFDNAMDRVSGVYKRWAQLWSFLFALLIAVVLNVSTIDVATSLWKQPIDTKAIVGITDQAQLPNYVKTVDQLNAMPLGWNAQLVPAAGATGGQWVWWLFLHVVGWVITAFATLFGAPFWFDALQQIVRLKGSGPSPAEKKDQMAASG